MRMNTINKPYKIFLNNGFKFEGTIVEDTEQFLLIHDNKSMKPVIIYKTSISTMEVL